MYTIFVACLAVHADIIKLLQEVQLLAEGIVTDDGPGGEFSIPSICFLYQAQL